jgi:hypothetical protein
LCEPLIPPCIHHSTSRHSNVSVIIRQSSLKFIIIAGILFDLCSHLAEELAELGYVTHDFLAAGGTLALLTQ